VRLYLIGEVVAALFRKRILFAYTYSIIPDYGMAAYVWVQAGLTPEQVRSLCQEIIRQYNLIKTEDK
jgi:hypothetical protein